MVGPLLSTESPEPNARTINVHSFTWHQPYTSRVIACQHEQHNVSPRTGTETKHVPITNRPTSKRYAALRNDHVSPTRCSEIRAQLQEPMGRPWCMRHFSLWCYVTRRWEQWIMAGLHNLNREGREWMITGWQTHDKISASWIYSVISLLLVNDVLICNTISHRASACPCVNWTSFLLCTQLDLLCAQSCVKGTV